MASSQNTIILLIIILLTHTPSSSSSSSSSTPIIHHHHNYKSALSNSLLYFESQRSGHLPYTQRITWRSDSGLTDGLDQNVDLVGGYYDAGDHVKFGLPMAFTVTMLSWSLITFPPTNDPSHYTRALEAIKWGTDYFVKAHTSPDVFWAEVGDGDTDHYCWQRAEDMSTSRRAYKIDRKRPGSDLAAETAASMAAASIVFRNVNPRYSRLLIHHAKQLFEFADKYRGKYDESIRVAKKYYESVSGYGDELLWAALWLYKATDKEEYLNYAVKNAESLGGVGWSIKEFSWDVKYAGVQILASQLLTQRNHHNSSSSDQYHRKSIILQQYKHKAEYYLCSNLGLNSHPSKNVNRTPAGLLYIREWNNLQYVTTATFLLTQYSDYLNTTNQTLNCPLRSTTLPSELLEFAKSQADYILGTNPMNMSYLVGYGDKYPERVHHRGASMVSYRVDKKFIGCTQGYDYWYGRKHRNPNVLVGAVVGGPDREDGFVDDRKNYVQTEACTYNTAPLLGVFVKLDTLSNSSGTVKEEVVVGSKNSVAVV